MSLTVLWGCELNPQWIQKPKRPDKGLVSLTEWVDAELSRPLTHTQSTDWEVLREKLPLWSYLILDKIMVSVVFSSFIFFPKWPEKHYWPTPRQLAPLAVGWDCMCLCVCVWATEQQREGMCIWVALFFLIILSWIIRWTRLPICFYVVWDQILLDISLIYCKSSAASSCGFIGDCVSLGAGLGMNIRGALIWLIRDWEQIATLHSQIQAWFRNNERLSQHKWFTRLSPSESYSSPLSWPGIPIVS